MGWDDSKWNFAVWNQASASTPLTVAQNLKDSQWIRDLFDVEWRKISHIKDGK